jgi:hypothetical protein
MLEHKDYIKQTSHIIIDLNLYNNLSRTIDGVTLPTFREAAETRGLLESDNTLDEYN